MKLVLSQVLSVVAVLALASFSSTQAATLIAHYPLDTVNGGTTTPDGGIL